MVSAEDGGKECSGAIIDGVVDYCGQERCSSRSGEYRAADGSMYSRYADTVSRQVEYSAAYGAQGSGTSDVSE